MYKSEGELGSDHLIFKNRNHGRYLSLKGHGNEADFLGFSQKLVPHESRSDFGFEFAEIFVFEK